MASGRMLAVKASKKTTLIRSPAAKKTATVKRMTNPRIETVTDTIETEIETEIGTETEIETGTETETETAAGIVAVEGARRETGTVAVEEARNETGTEIATGIGIVTVVVAVAGTAVTEIMMTGKGGEMTAGDEGTTAGAAEGGIGHGAQLPLQMNSVKSGESRRETGVHLALLLRERAVLIRNDAARPNGMLERPMRTTLPPTCQSG